MKTLAGGGWLDKEKTKPMNTSAAIKWVLVKSGCCYYHSRYDGFDHLDLNAKILEDISLNEQEKTDLIASMDEPGSSVQDADNACP